MTIIKLNNLQIFGILDIEDIDWKMVQGHLFKNDCVP